jgi:hypothetical protein
VDYYDSEYRRQFCRERIDQIRDEYRRAQAPPRNKAHWRECIVEIWAMRKRMRRQAKQRAPAYRS